MTAAADAQVVLLAKAPVPGQVKTRLTPPYSPDQAARLAEAALHDTVTAVLAAGVAHRVLALDGDPGPWVGSGLSVVPQRGAGLDERIAHALTDAWGARPLPVLLIGMDTPQLTASLLDGAVGRLLDAGVDAVLGPADDGGFWALGMRHPRPEHLLGVPMSTGSTGQLQHDRLLACGLCVALLPALRDVDTAADAAVVASGARWTRFARLVAELEVGAA